MFDAPNCCMIVHMVTDCHVLNGWKLKEKEERDQKFLDVDRLAKLNLLPLTLGLQLEHHLETLPVLRGICLNIEDGRRQCPWDLGG